MLDITKHNFLRITNDVFVVVQIFD